MSTTHKPAALAAYRDIWLGEVTATLIPFRTKRKGETVTRYRWVMPNGQGAGGWASPFVSVEGALKATERHACFKDGRRI